MSGVRTISMSRPTVTGSMADRITSAARGPATRGTLGVIIAIASVEIAVRTGLVSTDVVPSVGDIARSLVQLIGESEFWRAVVATMSAWLYAITVSMIVGSAVGVVVGRSRLLRAGMGPVVDAMRSTSAVALIPLAILVFGTGTQMKVALAVYASLWPMILGGIHGSASIERTLLDVARMLRWSWTKRTVRLVLPSALPFLVSALRSSSIVALVVVVSAEIIGGNDGLGRLVARSQQTGVALDRMYAVVVVTALIGLLADVLIAHVQRRLLKWHPAGGAR